MSDEQAEFHWNNLVQAFGDNLPNPEHEPRRFAYYVKIYKHLLKLHGENNAH